MITNTFLEKTSQLTDQVVHSADQAIKSTQHIAHDALESAIKTTQQLREKAQDASECTVNYIKHEPLKSVLIAAATGAALMALVSLVSRSGSRG